MLGITPGLLILPVGYLGGLDHAGIYVCLSALWVIGCALWTQGNLKRTLDLIVIRLAKLFLANMVLLAVAAVIFWLFLAPGHH